jgi:hypothetical protein
MAAGTFPGMSMRSKFLPLQGMAAQGKKRPPADYFFKAL